jgi:hypothetical protein
MPRHDQGNELVDVEIDRVVRLLERSIVVEKDGEEYVVGHEPIDNLDDILEAFRAKKEVPDLTVPRWLARKNDWPEAE